MLKVANFAVLAWAVGFGLKFGLETAQRWMDLLDKIIGY